MTRSVWGICQRNQGRQVQVRRGGNRVQAAQDLGDFGQASKLVAVIGYGLLPERDGTSVNSTRCST